MIGIETKKQYFESLSDICSFCTKTGADDFVPVYWNNATIETKEGNLIAHRPVHKHCKAEQRALEAYECQKIDAGCNDCGYFQRKINHKNYAEGHCLKFDKPTKAYPQFASGHECFVHRKDMERRDLMIEYQSLIKAARMALEPLRIYMTDEQLSVVVDAVMKERKAVIHKSNLIGLRVRHHGNVYTVYESNCSLSNHYVDNDTIRISLTGALPQ